MFEFLGRGRPKTEKSTTDPGPSTLPQLGPNSATQREMARFSLQNVFKRRGIPSSWFNHEVLQAQIPGQGEVLILQLEVMHWHDALVLHAPVLQRELQDEFRRFDPEAGRTRYFVTWKFSPNCNCPHTQLPEPGFWGPQAAAATALDSAAPTPPASPPISFELPSGDMDEEDDDHGFAPTQIQKY